MTTPRSIPSHGPSRALTRALLLAVAVAALFAFARWRDASSAPEVEVVEVVRGVVRASFTADGIVRARSVDLAPRGPARVAALLVREGQSVSPGEVLARFEAGELRARLREADAAVAAAQAAVRQADAAVSLTRRQSAAAEAQARAALREAEAMLRQTQAGARAPEIAQAQQQADAARARMIAAEQAVRRLRDLHAAGAVARADLDNAEADLAAAVAQHRAALETVALLRAGARPEERAAAQARVDAARAALSRTRTADDEIRAREADRAAAGARLAQARAAAAAAAAALGDTVLTAPFAGVIGHVPVELGQIAGPSAPVLTLLDPRETWVRADITGEDAAKIRIGQPVTVTAASYPGRRFRGVVEEIAPEAETKPDAALRTRVVRVRVRLLDGEGLRPGLEVDVEGTAAVAGAALIVPADAISLRDDRTGVFVVDGGRAQFRAVRTGYQTARIVEILDGLREGELVIVRGKDQVTPGGRVRIVATAPR